MSTTYDVRRFNDQGIEAFRQYLRQLRETPSLPPPLQLLDDPALSSVVPGVGALTRPGFATKRQAAVYLQALLKPIAGQGLFKDVGLWTWLTLFFFDDVCPPNGDKRQAANVAHYVFDAFNYRRYYKHLLAMPLQVLEMAPGHNRLFLDMPLPVLGQVMERMAGRLYLMRIPCVPEVLDALYFDAARGKQKRNVANPNQKARAGDLANRFPIRIRQLQKTYDVYSLGASDLIRVLGSEFSRWADTSVLEFPEPASGK